jgi:hypothetical protein
VQALSRYLLSVVVVALALAIAIVVDGVSTGIQPLPTADASAATVASIAANDTAD